MASCYCKTTFCSIIAPKLGLSNVCYFVDATTSLGKCLNLFLQGCCCFGNASVDIGSRTTEGNVPHDDTVDSTLLKFSSVHCI